MPSLGPLAWLHDRQDTPCGGPATHVMCGLCMAKFLIEDLDEILPLQDEKRCPKCPKEEIND